MQINRKNYEAFMLDYLEGNLSLSERTAFEVFLDENTDLKSHIFQPENLRLLPDPVFFHNKDSLKKDPLTSLRTLPEPDLTFIAFIENDLPITSKTAFLKKAKEEPSIHNTLTQYEKVILKADQVVFKNKKSLKKSAFSIPPRIIQMATTAAAIVIFLLLYQFFTNKFHSPEPSPVSEVVIATPTYSEKTKQPSSLMPPNKQESKIVPRKIQSSKEKFTMRSRATLAENTRHRLPPMRLLISPATKERPEVIQSSLLTSEVQPPTLYFTQLFGEEELLTFENYKIKKFRLKILDAPSFNESYPPLWLTLANLGIKGINKLAKWNMELKTNYNEQGDLSNLAFHSRVLDFTSQLKNTNSE